MQESRIPRHRFGFAFDRPAPGAVSWLGLAVATALGFALRVIGLTTQALWTDEVESLKLVMQPGADPLYVLTHNFHGPLHKLLVLIWTLIFGAGDASARMLSVAIGTLTIPLLYLAGRRWVGERAALWGAFLLAINPFHIWYSQEVRGYVLLMALGIAASWAFLHEIRRRSMRSALTLGACTLAASLSSFGGLFLIGTHGALGLLAAWRRGYPWHRLAVIYLLVLACLVPYFTEFGTTVDPESIVGIGEVDETDLLRGSHTFSILAPAHSAFAYSVGTTLGPSINEMHESLTLETFRSHIPIIALSGLVFGAVVLVGMARSHRRPELAGFLLIWLVMPIALTAALALVNLKVYNVRYPSAGFGAWILLLALGIEGFRPRAARVAAVALVVGLSALSIWKLNTETRYWRPDARAAARLVLEEGRPGDRVLIYTTVEPFVYYYQWRGRGLLDVARLSVWELRKRERLEAFWADVTGCDGRLWVVRQRSWYIDPNEIIKARLDRELTHIRHWDLPELPVDLYRCRPAAGGIGGD